MRSIFIAIGKAAIVVVAVILCLVGGALSLDAHNDALLIVAGLCALAALALAVLGSLWVFRSLRDLAVGRDR